MIKPKEPLTTEQETQITTLAAGGWSVNKISKHIGRSRHMVKNHLAKPEVKKTVQDEKAELATIYRDKARMVAVSIDAEDIDKASLQQKAISSGVLLDKSLLLSGDPTINLNIGVFVDAVEKIKLRDKEEQERNWKVAHARIIPDAKDCRVANCPVHSPKLALPAPNEM